jgi:hypothetical protein
MNPLPPIPPAPEAVGDAGAVSENEGEGPAEPQALEELELTSRPPSTEPGNSGKAHGKKEERIERWMNKAQKVLRAGLAAQAVDRKELEAELGKNQDYCWYDTMSGIEQGLEYIKIDIDVTQTSVNRAIENFNLETDEQKQDEGRQFFYEELTDSFNMMTFDFRKCMMALKKTRSMAKSHNEYGGDPAESQGGSGGSIASGGRGKERGVTGPPHGEDQETKGVEGPQQPAAKQVGSRHRSCRVPSMEIIDRRVFGRGNRGSHR